MKAVLKNIAVRGVLIVIGFMIIWGAFAHPIKTIREIERGVL